jgi:hypothetical protein
MKKKLFLAFGALIVAWMIYLLIVNLQPPSQAESIVVSAECEPPCWRGITPGKTSGDEVYELFSKFPDRLAGGGKGGASTIFDAYYVFDLSGDIRVVVTTIDGTVAIIGFLREEGLMTFENAINKFGSPQYATQSFYMARPVFLTPATHMYFNALNIQKGVAFAFDTNRRFPPKQSVSESTLVTEITYFDSHKIEILLKQGLVVSSQDEFEIKDLIIWKGYGNISELYPYDK